MLGVSPESYRTWDAGRRVPPPKILARARALAMHRDEQALLLLSVLVLLIGVHVKTLPGVDSLQPEPYCCAWTRPVASTGREAPAR